MIATSLPDLLLGAGHVDCPGENSHGLTRYARHNLRGRDAQEGDAALIGYCIRQGGLAAAGGTVQQDPPRWLYTQPRIHLTTSSAN